MTAIKPLASTATRTFAHQSHLPRLPIPTVRDTAARYLRSVQPLAQPATQAWYQDKELSQLYAATKSVGEAFEREKSLIVDFTKEDGEGERLQKRLLAHAETAQPHWLDAWWLDKAYLEWRESLLINSNYYVLFVDDPMQPTDIAHVDDRARGVFTEWQVRRAAHLVGRMLDAVEALRGETFPVERTKTGPICMNQYRNVFGVTRVPRTGKDELVGGEWPPTDRHISVLIWDQFYEVPVYTDGTNTRLSNAAIERQLWKVIDNIKHAQLDAPVGLLTADTRDAWATNYRHLVAHPTNHATLHSLTRSLFHLALDDHAWTADTQRAHRNVLHGPDGHNRWFDKCVTIVVDANGRAGWNGEHSPCDALIPALVSDWCLGVSIGEGAIESTSEGSVREPTRMRFVVDDAVRGAIKDAQRTADALIADSASHCLAYEEYGTDYIKRIAKVSPDAYLQMALQLAYYRTHGRCVPTYETASTRQFYHGRTDTTRTLSTPSVNFVLGMENTTANVTQKYELLRKATEYHQQLTRDGVSGQAIDRHLLGLRLAYTLPSLTNEPDSPYTLASPHPLFTSPMYTYSQTWTLSTSGLHPGPKFLATGFGAPVGVRDAYGVNYLAAPERIRFGIECKRSMGADLDGFVANLILAMGDMRAVVQATCTAAKL